MPIGWRVSAHAPVCHCDRNRGLFRLSDGKDTETTPWSNLRQATQPETDYVLIVKRAVCDASSMSLSRRPSNTFSRAGRSRAATSYRLPGDIGEGVAGVDEIGGARRVRHPQSGVLERRAHPERLEHPR
jgi:hypothetical protein